jgi:hypothetical protein
MYGMLAIFCGTQQAREHHARYIMEQGSCASYLGNVATLVSNSVEQLC